MRKKFGAAVLFLGIVLLTDACSQAGPRTGDLPGQAKGTVPPDYQFSWFEKIVPVGNYGNWCGAKPTIAENGQKAPKAIDGLDACCRAHDQCYPPPARDYCMSDVQALRCNRRLLQCTEQWSRQNCGVTSKPCTIAGQIKTFFDLSPEANSTCRGPNCCPPKKKASLP